MRKQSANKMARASGEIPSWHSLQQFGMRFLKPGCDRASTQASEKRIPPQKNVRRTLSTAPPMSCSKAHLVLLRFIISRIRAICFSACLSVSHFSAPGLDFPSSDQHKLVVSWPYAVPTEMAPPTARAAASPNFTPTPQSQSNREPLPIVTQNHSLTYALQVQ
jgi:hypothetical protein